MPRPTPPPVPTDEVTTADNAPLNLEQFALDQISDRLRRKFSGHALACLVDAILQAQGYQTHGSALPLEHIWTLVPGE